MKIEQTSSAVDQMLRQTRAHHVQLSIMADFKANMLMTVATLLLTGASQYISDPIYGWPATLLCLFCVLTLLLAIYAVMPKIWPNTAKATREESRGPMFNLLFFGDFTRMQQADFESEFERMINDKDLVHHAVARELYTMGQYLQKKKYRYLRLSYMSFALGIISSTGTLFVAHFAAMLK